MSRGYAVSRYHDISTGHRVVGHENKCRHLHGHNYRIHFECVSSNRLFVTTEDDEQEEIVELDDMGMVIDFGVIKSHLCMWVEAHWDHKFLLWEEDPILKQLQNSLQALVHSDIEIVPFNPTAENMAAYLVQYVGPQQLEGTGVILRKVLIEETRKCSATYERAV